MSTLPERLRLVRASLGRTQKEMANLLGVGEMTWQNYERGATPPRADLLEALVRLGFNGHWLLSGNGPMEADRREGGETVPVLGPAGCDAGAVRLAVRALKPGDISDHNAFAVMVTGTGLVPAGIHPGFLCFCSPVTSPDPGDVVHVERRDGRTLLGVLVALGEVEAVLQRWTATDAGVANPISEAIARADIRAIVPVIYVKRKL